MTSKKKPLHESGNESEKNHSGNYTSTSDHKQRLISKFPIIRLDVNDLVNYARRKAEGGDDDGC